MQICTDKKENAQNGNRCLEMGCQLQIINILLSRTLQSNARFYNYEKRGPKNMNLFSGIKRSNETMCSVLFQATHKLNFHLGLMRRRNHRLDS